MIGASSSSIPPLRVRPKVMRAARLSCGLLDHVLPVRLPATIDPIQPERQHGLGLLDAPPSTRALQTLLNDIAMCTLDLAGADGQSALLRALVVELFAAVVEIALRGPHRGVGIGDRLWLQMVRQLRQDRVESIRLEPLLLAVQPGHWVGGAGLGGRAQILAGMIEIDQKLALLTELLVDLIGDPRRAVADGMHARVGAETGLSGTVEELASHPLDTPLKGSAITGRRTAQGMHQAQFGFFPRQALPPALVGLRGIRGHDWHHPAIAFRDQPRGSRFGGPVFFRFVCVKDRLRMTLHDLTDRLHRQRHPIVFE